MISFVGALVLLSTLSASANGAWTKENFKTAVYFGDSYTDTGRGMTKRPAGWVEPERGGFAKNWPVFVKQFSQTSKHNYAMSGSSCSTKLINAPKSIPGIQQTQLPQFMADLAYKNKDGSPFMRLPAESTVYAIWIGTNDLGGFGFLNMANGLQKIPEFVECVYTAYDKIYANGGRKFILMNVVPLHILPMYSSSATKSQKLEKLVSAANRGFANKTMAVMQGAKPRYPDAEFALFDVYKLVTDISKKSKPCAGAEAKMWADGLHPSPALGKCIAKEFVNVANGASKYTVYSPALAAGSQ